MKPFNLAEYLKNPYRKIVTRDGRNVRIICTDRNPDKYPVENYGNYPIIALVQGDFREDVLCYTKDGLFLLGFKEPEDLFFALEKKEGWINLYKDNDCKRGGIVYSTEQEAKEVVDENDDYVATIKIEWEE
nr:MAG TPA: hypothetical protein [Caudoviricetes sp.]